MQLDFFDDYLYEDCLLQCIQVKTWSGFQDFSEIKLIFSEGRNLLLQYNTGSSVSGENVNISAGDNVLITASNVHADNNLAVRAEKGAVQKASCPCRRLAPNSFHGAVNPRPSAKISSVFIRQSPPVFTPPLPGTANIVNFHTQRRRTNIFSPDILNVTRHDVE